MARRAAALSVAALLAGTTPARADDFDPWSVLGISRDADVSEVKKAYRRLSVKLHPDRNPGNAEAQAEFGRVSRAHEVLTDEVARHAAEVGQFHSVWEYEQWKHRTGKAGGGSGFFRGDSPVQAWTGAEIGMADRAAPIVLMFYAPWCVHCQNFAAQYKTAARQLADDGRPTILAAINCEEHGHVCQNERIQAYPTFRLLHPAPTFAVENYPYGTPGTAEDVLNWLDESASTNVEPLDEAAFDAAVMGDGGVWIVVFTTSAGWCGTCAQFAPILRRMARDLAGYARVGSVDCEHAAGFCQHRMMIDSWPTVKLFPIGAARKAEFGEGRGQNLYIAHEYGHFPPAAALDLTKHVLRALLPPGTTVVLPVPVPPAPPTLGSEVGDAEDGDVDGSREEPLLVSHTVSPDHVL